MADVVRDVVGYRGTVRVSADDVEVAEVLLTMTTEQSCRVLRKDLRAEWGTFAPDLRITRGSNPSHEARDRGRGRGSVAAHRLKNGLAVLEKLGAACRTGEGETLAVVVTDRALLAQLVNDWDTDPPR